MFTQTVSLEGSLFNETAAVTVIVVIGIIALIAIWLSASNKDDARKANAGLGIVLSALLTIVGVVTALAVRAARDADLMRSLLREGNVCVFEDNRGRIVLDETISADTVIIWGITRVRERPRRRIAIPSSNVPDVSAALAKEDLNITLPICDSEVDSNLFTGGA